MTLVDLLFYVIVMVGVLVTLGLIALAAEALLALCARLAVSTGAAPQEASHGGPVPNLVPLPAELRARVMARDNFTCVKCGATEDLTVDHKIPRHLGGSNHPSNLQTLCRPCNSEKGTHLYD